MKKVLLVFSFVTVSLFFFNINLKTNENENVIDINLKNIEALARTEKPAGATECDHSQIDCCEWPSGFERDGAWK